MPGPPLTARVIERRRLHHLLDGGSSAGLLAALDAYQNPDGGYGWGLEPDQRSSTSQPVAAMHALEVLAAIGDDSDRAPGICGWLGEHSLPDGGTPFGLPYSDTSTYSPAAALAWRGYATVHAIATLRGATL
ncbi:hypothetical protein ABIA31_007858 [Catenulispora sp. MAP5-51]|uniref:hypothetical protein n=1 Tax=Catenulispora sp. MAP5-51 TaxID=3156298 RepID=UPI003512E37D